MPREATCNPTVGWTQQAEELCVLPNGVHLQTSEAENVQPFMREQAGMGCPSWWEVEPDIGRTTTESTNWTHKLKALGNGQVPLQAALAWKLLSKS